MESVERIADLRAAIRARRPGANGQSLRVGFVPTMGYLHAGHLALIDEARRRADLVVASIFVNPMQFGPTEDLARYPRDPVGDATKLASHGVDLLFTPPVDEIYPEPPSIRVDPGELGARWEGAVRPGHFAGVLTVVAKLFHIVQPDIAVFGRKDAQQAILVRRMVRELNVPVDVCVVPTTREPDGLAMSSRNSYLDADDRQRALALVRSLRATVAAFSAGERSGARLTAIGADLLSAAPGVQVDYFAVVDPLAMREVAAADASCYTIVAARVGTTRLIDNAILGEWETAS